MSEVGNAKFAPGDKVRIASVNPPGHRRVPNFGMEGGELGALGHNVVRRADGTREELPGCAQTVLEAGEAI